MRYKGNEVVTTEDGRRHRVIYQSSKDGRLSVKSLDDKHRKQYKIAAEKVVSVEPRS